MLLSAALPKTLETRRLTLELFDRSDAHYACLLSCVNSATAYKAMGDLRLRTPADLDALNASARLRATATALDADVDLYYVMRPRRPAASPLVGGVSLGQRAAQQPPDVGWAVLEGHMGHGYATEAAAALLEMLRATLQVKEVMAWPGVGNKASVRVAEKLGMVRGGLLPDKDGKMHAVYLMPGMEFDEGMAMSLWGS